MQVSIGQITTLSDEDLASVATAPDNTYPDEIVLATWEELAARGVVIDFDEHWPLIRETMPDDLLTVATFRSYVQAQFAQIRLLASGIPAFLFDDQHDSNELGLGYGARLCETAGSLDRDSGGDENFGARSR